MSTASSMPSPTAPTKPLSAKWSAVPSMPLSQASTMVLTPPPNRSTASSAVSAQAPSASSVNPSVSVTRPMPPSAVPPTNLVTSETARPASATTPSSSSSSSSSCGISTNCEAGVAALAFSHSGGVEPRNTAACTRLCADISAAFWRRSSAIWSLNPGTTSLQSSSRYSAFSAFASVCEVATFEANRSAMRACSAGTAAILPATA
mmetsp:Transcript_81389/g.264195  ORF Transcript_81389/g.264195 Transcript_81389/m.264195 type:complete len:205 (+) Transcript_81389:600-1214(+)